MTHLITNPANPQQSLANALRSLADRIEAEPYLKDASIEVNIHWRNDQRDRVTSMVRNRVMTSETITIYLEYVPEDQRGIRQP